MSKKRAPKKKARAKPPAKKKSHGGARDGAGRKRDALPKALLDKIGDVPEAAKIDDWRMNALAVLFKAQAAGDVGTELAASLRATLGEMRRNAVINPDAGDDEDEDEDDGPELQEVGAGGALRIDP